MLMYREGGGKLRGDVACFSCWQQDNKINDETSLFFLHTSHGDEVTNTPAVYLTEIEFKATLRTLSTPLLLFCFLQ